MTLKRWTLILVVGLANLGLWLTVKPWLVDPLVLTVSHWLWPLLVFLLAAALVCLALILLPRGKFDLAVIGAVLLTFWLVFGWSSNIIFPSFWQNDSTKIIISRYYFLISGGILAGLFLLWGAER